MRRTSTSPPPSRHNWRYGDDFEVANRPAAGVITRRPEEPYTTSVRTVLWEPGRATAPATRVDPRARRGSVGGSLQGVDVDLENHALVARVAGAAIASEAMERIVDLDLAAAEIERRRPSWLANGLQPGPTTWRESAGSWPFPIVPDRARVTDPDSVGIVVKADARGAMEIVLFRGGWADLTVVVYDHQGDPVLAAPDIATPEAFGVTLDDSVQTLLAWLR